AWPWERMAVHHIARQSQLNTETPHLILEQLPQRLDELEFHLLGQTTDVVMGLDHVGLAGAGTGGRDDIRIDRAVRQEFHAGQLVCFLIEYLDEGATDDLALLLRISDTREHRKEALFGIDPNDAYAEMLGKRTHHLVAFTEPQEPVIDEDAHQL